MPVVDWSGIACGADGKPCINYDGGEEAKKKLTTETEFQEWIANYSYQDANSLVYANYSKSIDGSTVAITSLDGIEGVIYASRVGGRWDYPDNIYSNTNNTLYVNLGHTDPNTIVDVNGSATARGTWVAAVGKTGSADGNRLLIKDSNLRHTANLRANTYGSEANTFFALAAVSKDTSVASDGSQYLDTVSYKDNLIYIDNSSILKAENSPLGYRNSLRTVVFSGGTWDHNNPDFEFTWPTYAVNNSLVINKSKVEAYLIATNYTYRTLHNTDTHAEDGLLYLNDSQLVLGLNTGATTPRTYFTVASGFTDSARNKLVVQNSEITTDFSGVGADSTSDMLLAAMVHGNRSSQNEFIFKNSSLKAVNEEPVSGDSGQPSGSVLPENGTQGRAVEMFGSTDEIYQEYIFGRSANGNSLWVVADAGRNTFDVENSSLVLGGARTQNYWSINDQAAPSGKATTTTNNNSATV